MDNSDIINIKDFLPKYPNINQSKYDLFNIYDDFYDSIYNKQEFFEERLPLEEKIPKKGDLFKIQKIISRFMSSYTLYNGLLLAHEMGTGKTCAAVAVIEKLKNENFGINGALILAPGKNLLDNFAQEVVMKCTDGRYIPSNFQTAKDNSEKMRMIRHSIKKFYKFETFRKFASKVRKMTEKNIITDFSNMIIVIDEVHHLHPKKAKDKEDLLTYYEIKRFCNLVKDNGSKVLLMSGTPMTDSPSEIYNILSLITKFPQDNEEDFEKEYFYENRDGILDVKEHKKKELKSYMKGYVSYLKGMESSVKKVFVGEKLKHFVIDIDEMSDYQSSEYIKAYNLDHRTKGIYSNSRQASLFVYPKTSSGKILYGAEGFKHHIKEKKTKYVIGGKEHFSFSYSLIPETENQIKGNTHEETLNNIQLYSSKYAKVIKQILNAKNKSIFVYTELVSGSGGIIFTKLLEMFGFNKATGSETQKGLRYAFLTTKLTSPSQIIQIKNRFNNPDNMFGDYIKVIIGSGVVTEGFSLFNVQEEHILTPFWNYTPIVQALARGLRVMSHKALIDNGIIPVVKLYQHASVPNNKSTSIDLHMYEISEKKDVSIKFMERLMEESSIDCKLTIKRNKRNDGDGSRNCNYQKCRYKCDGGNKLSRDYSTYQLYYSSEYIPEIISDIKEIFQKEFIINWKDIMEKLEYMYEDFLVLQVLNYMIDNNTIITNKYGLSSYLREQNNVYYIIENVNTISSYTDSYYTQNPFITNYKPLKKVIMSKYIEKIPSMIKMMKTVKDFPKYMKRFPDIAQELFIEKALYDKSIGKEADERVLKLYKQYIHLSGSMYWSSYLYDTRKLLKCLTSEGWGKCDQNIYDRYRNQTQKQFTNIKDSEYNYYASYIDGKFKIIDKSQDEMTDKRKINKGKSCDSWSIPDLIKVFLEIPIDIPGMNDIKDNSKEFFIKELMKNNKFKDLLESMDIENETLENIQKMYLLSSKRKKSLCNMLKKWFEEKELLITK